MDASVRALETARRRVLDRLPPERRERVTLMHGAMTYRDGRLAGYDAAAAIEVTEHFDPSRLGAFERAVFRAGRPKAAMVTTLNREYNARFPDLAPGEPRHPDHRFEWDRAEFRSWAEGIAGWFGTGWSCAWSEGKTPRWDRRRSWRCSSGDLGRRGRPTW